jgi:glutamyl-tRNA synthetase
MTKRIIRTRFAVSPTGYLHVGGLRNALYSYIFAKQNNGQYVLRIEDTDQKREVKGAAKNLIRVLEKVGLKHDEGPVLENNKIVDKGEFGPYTQSKRIDLYQKYAEQLVSEKKAYYCFCTPERLDQMRKKQQAQKKPPRYDRQCLNLSDDDVAKKIENNEKHVVRFRIPDGVETSPSADGLVSTDEVVCDDLVHGKVKFKISELDDFVILKSDGFATYHLAHVIDDYLMKISHVLRGDEWLPSLPKHLLLWQAFGWDAPRYAHLPLLLNPDKSKLSKRQGDVSVEGYLKQGYLPEVIINFVALLGWNPGKGSEQEIFSLDELIKKFDIKKVNKSGAVFNIDKISWMNGLYIRKMDFDQLVEKCLPYIEEYLKINKVPFDKKDKKDIEYATQIISIEQERLKKLSDIVSNIEFFYHDNTEYDAKKLIWKKSDQAATKKNLQLAFKLLNSIDKKDFTKINLETKFYNLIEKEGISAGDILWPLRYALTGVDKSPSPFEVAWVLGKAKSLERIKIAINKL